jgi:hypothetical protein
MVDLFELVAARLADADRLAAEPRLEMADRLVLSDLRAAEADAGLDPVGNAPLRGRAHLPWFGHNRCLGKDFENLPETLGAFATLALHRLALKQLARA